MRRRAALFVGAVLAVRVTFVACTGDDPVVGGPDKPAGDEGGPCFDDKTCRTGLTCLSGRCVRSPGADGSIGGDGSTGGDKDADAELDASADASGCEPGAPCTIPNLVAWYRADRGVIENQGGVTRWEDQSPRRHHAHLLDGDSPPALVPTTAFFDGGPRVEFDGLRGGPQAERLVTAPFASSFSSATIYLVFSRANDTRPTSYILDGIRNGASNVIMVGQNPPSARLLAEYSIVADVDVPPDTATLFEAVFNGRDSGLYINESAKAEEDLGAQPFTGLTLGSRYPDAASTPNFAGSIAELVVYSGVQSPADRATVVRWLRTRHGF
jgi:hypothetical protein